MAEGQQPQILNKTLGDLLQNNNHAQGIVMQAMQISPQQLQQMLNLTGNNKLMNMTIGDLFKNGIVQQATAINPNDSVVNGTPIQITNGQSTQLSPQQLQQIMGIFKNGQVPKGASQEYMVPYTFPTVAAKPSFFQKLKNLFK
jgi:hypothetical protein